MKTSPTWTPKADGEQLSPLIIRLPLPPKELSPNARIHFMARSRAVKKARAVAMWLTWSEVNRGLNQLRPIPEHQAESYNVGVHFVLPDKRARDEDNLMASCKSFFDGCADALGVNDARFRYGPITREVRKGEAAVEITIGATP